MNRKSIITIFLLFVAVVVNSNLVEAASEIITNSTTTMKVNPKIWYLYYDPSRTTPIITKSEALEGLSAYDEVDGDISNKIAPNPYSLIFNKISQRGQNSVQYTVTNSKGIRTSISRTYEIGLEPQIYGDDATINLGNVPNVATINASATDFSGFNAKVKADYSQVDFNVPGTYPVTLSAPTGKPWTDDPSILNMYKVVNLTIKNVPKVYANFLDEEGNTIASSQVYSGNVGDPYTTEEKIIEGYTLKKIRGNITGTFTEDEQTVMYIYTKNPVLGGSVTAKYLDKPGNPIDTNSVYTGNVGESYETEQKTIAGYSFTEVQGNPTGTFTEAEQTVTYVYTKNPVAGASVTAKYVDEQGNAISDNIVLNGDMRESYTTKQKTIAGYTFKEVQGNTTGTFTEAEQSVTYVYIKNIKEETDISKDSGPTNQIDQSEKAQSKLPKTGEIKSSFMILIEFLSSFIGLLGISRIKKNKVY